MTSKKTTREQKERIQLGSVYWGLKVLLEQGLLPEEDIQRFNPEHLKRWPQATRAVITGSDFWCAGYVDNMVLRGLVERDGKRNVIMRDREAIEALLKAHDEGGVELSDLVFKKDAPLPPPQQELQLPAEGEPHDPVQVLTDMAERMVDYMAQAGVTEKQIWEGVQGINKRVGALERQLAEALSGLNGAIRVMQDVDATKLAASVSVVARAQGELRNAVFEKLDALEIETRATRAAASEISVGLKAREDGKLDRALSDLQSGLELLVEVRGRSA